MFFICFVVGYIRENTLLKVKIKNDLCDIKRRIPSDSKY